MVWGVVVVFVYVARSGRGLEDVVEEGAFGSEGGSGSEGEVMEGGSSEGAMVSR